MGFEPYAWAVLVGSVLANRTRGQVFRPALWSLLRRWPTPADMARADAREVEEVIKRCGLQRRRAERLVELSAAWERGVPARDMGGVGEYASRSYAIFVEGVLGEGPPRDGKLLAYWRWRKGRR